MQPRVFFLCSAAVAATLLFVGASAQSNTCTNTITSLAPCLNYISGNSTTPSDQCCRQLRSVVQSDPQCLCMVINGGASSLGIEVNQTQALALPGACNEQTPPLSQCNVTNGFAPADAPSGGDIVEVPVFLLFSLLLAMAYLSSSPTSF
ncbi:uncharacterized protein A4U43_C03F5230 [Asparagus officinalis]|uniref:Bifunctional inhibitor/plant lipid transfer protein/seed storage helical domain-containing protein n=1 Tax=Asparagus officinalis TaxID=4686 RepID=A0A5P1FCR1_ASPOF|nr:non-specific lipid-transfer protein-like protein At5g64080 [Asparagus officinalis]ONK74340.1 uncharacterized protein A4U43_C03F5230 [Asparagus officinalis]